MFATLHHSVRLNGFGNVRLRNCCAGDRTRSATLWMNFDRPHSSSLLKHDPDSRGFSVLEVALDDPFAWEGLQGLDYLKIDAEGAERRILCGARNTLCKHRPIIQLEAVIEDNGIDLPHYRVFQAPRSNNKIYVPAEHPKAALPEQLGWNRLA